MYVIIADSHVGKGDAAETSFFAMLDAIAATDYDVLFLGDNLDLWIASAPRYENASHARFLAWCRREKEHRQVILVEGNHEFYVCRHHRDCFSHCTEEVFRLPGYTFVHGDMVQHWLGFHRCFRLFAKNWLGDFIMAWLPLGVPFARMMKRLLCHKGGRTRDFIPRKLIARWVEKDCKASGNQRCFMGHFHCGGEVSQAGRWQCTILPAWKYAETIGLLDESTGQFTLKNWREALPEGKKP